MSDKSNSKLIIIIGILAVAVFAAGFCFINSGNGSEAVAKPVNDSRIVQAADADSIYASAPDFALEDLEGNSIKLSDLKGKVVFVNFWATWCPPCRREIPHFIELHEEFSDQGFEILGIAVDSREFDSVAPFVKKAGMNYPVMLDKKGVSQLYGGVSAIPTTFVVNRNGRIVSKIEGSRSKAEFKKLITENL